MRSQIIIVDMHDNQIGLKPSGTIGYEDIYRVSALWLTDASSGDILLAQRTWTEENDPGTWACAAAGTVEDGESYEDNIIKETQEEIGLAGLVFSAGPKQFVDDKTHKFFCQWFFSSVDRRQTKFHLQTEEVEAIRWVSQRELISDLAKNPQKYPPSTGESLTALGILPNGT